MEWRGCGGGEDGERQEGEWGNGGSVWLDGGKRGGRGERYTVLV